MNRRHFLASTTALALTACATQPAPGRAKPNIVLILCDDLGYGDLGVYGNRVIATPNLDRMAREGARSPPSSPPPISARPPAPACLTGRYPIRTGLATQVIQPDDTRGLPHSEITIAEALKPSDYTTALVGKWHLGHVAPYWPPTGHGFDLFFGLPYSHDMKPLAPLQRPAPGVELTQEDVDLARLTERFFQRGLQIHRRQRDASPSS